MADFIERVDLNALKTDNRYQKAYHFNAAPLGYKDSKECIDDISIDYDKQSKSFSLRMSNSFYVEDTQACSEHQIFYQFTITKNKIKLMNISAAG